MIEFLYFLYRVLSNLIYFYSLLVVVYTLFSWVPALMNSKIGDWIGKLVEPYLRIFDERIPAFGGISISPIIAILVLYVLNRYVLYYVFYFILQLF